MQTDCSLSAARCDEGLQVDDDHSASGSSRDSISFHPVTGGAVLFNAANGKLYALNPVAGLTWLCLRDGLSPAESTLALSNGFAIEHALAAEWFQNSVQLFRRLGLLANGHHTDVDRWRDISQTVAALGPPSLRPGRGVEYRLFEHHVRINAPDDLRSAIDSLLGRLRIDMSTPPRVASGLQIDIVATGEGWDITLDGKVELRCETTSVVAEVERLLIQSVVPATPHLLTLHAAAVQRDGRTLLLVGPSGSGKTTLSLALARAGWSFGSDEIVLLGRGFDLRPSPLPPCIKSDAFPFVETWFPELRSTLAHRRYGRLVKYLPVDFSPFVPTPVHVVFPHYDLRSGGDIRCIDAFAGLERLLKQCVFIAPGFRPDDVGQLLRWHDGLHYLDLTYDDCETAVALLTSIFMDNSQPP
jgi:hypothetical protein